MADYNATNTSEFADLINEVSVTLQPGDRLLLEPGVTFSHNNLNLPVKSMLSWPIDIMTSGYDAFGWAQWRRAGLSDVSSMATLQATGNSVLWGPHGTGWYRFLGLNFAAENTSPRTSLVHYWLDVAQTGPNYPKADLPKCTFRHCVFNPAEGVVHALLCNTGEAFIESNYIGPVLRNGAEPHAIAGSDDFGPYYIRNNFLSANSINVLFGGAFSSIERDPSAAPTVYAQCNHLYFDPAYGSTWHRKNMFELKHSHFALIEGNVFDGYWSDTQAYGIALNDSIGDTYDGLARVTFRRNHFKAIETIWAYGFGVHANTRSLHFYDNLWDGLGEDPRSPGVDSDQVAMLMTPKVQDVQFHHNTIIGASSGARTNTLLMVLTAGTHDGTMKFDDNIIIMPWLSGTGRELTQDSGPGHNKVALDNAFSGGGSYTFQRNAIARHDGAASKTEAPALPADNDLFIGGSRIADMIAKLNANFSVKLDQSGTLGEDWNAYSTTGGRIGADIELIETWTDGVEAGLPTALINGRHLTESVNRRLGGLSRRRMRRHRR